MEGPYREILSPRFLKYGPSRIGRVYSNNFSKFIFTIFFHFSHKSIKQLSFVQVRPYSRIFRNLFPWSVLVYPGFQRPKKNGTSGSWMARPRSSTSCSASLRYSNLSDIFGQLKWKRTSTTVTTDSLQPLRVRGYQIISEIQRPLVLRV